MNLASQNINGITNRIEKIIEEAINENWDIYCLQEIHKVDNKIIENLENKLKCRIISHTNNEFKGKYYKGVMTILKGEI